MRLKYIIDKYGNFALFSEANTHRDMAKGFYSHPISAGFCNIKLTLLSIGVDMKIECYGESISLNLESREEDSDIITRKLNGYQ